MDAPNEDFIDAVLTGGIKSGYNLALVPGTQAVPSASLPSGCTPGYSDGYVATANPVTVGTTGQVLSARTQLA